MTYSFSVDRILGARSFAEIGHPALTVADGQRGLLAVAGTHSFSKHPTVGVYDRATLSCRALIRSRDVVQAMAFHPTLPLLAVGTGSYDGGYFFSGDLLLLNLETGTSVSAFEHWSGRQVLELEWLDEQRLRLLIAPPDDWQDGEAHTQGHTAVVVRPDWTSVAPGSIAPHELVGPRIPAPRPEGRAAAYQLVSELGPDWDPRLTVQAVQELSDGRILATLGGVQLECWLPSGTREWAVPDEEGGREIAVARDENTAWVSLARPERHNRRTQSLVRLSLADGAEVDQAEPSGYVSLSRAADGDPLLAPSGYRIRGVPVAAKYPFHIRHASRAWFLSYVKKEGTRRSHPGIPWVATAELKSGRGPDRPTETKKTDGLRLFPYSWVPDEEHFGGPGVEAADGSLIHAGTVFRQSRQPGDSFVVRREASDGTPRWVFLTDCNATALDTDSTTAFITYDDGEIVALDLDDGTVLWRHRLTLGNVTAIPTALTVSQPGRLLIGTRDGRILICSVTT
ncbi:PQQ enzyme repeat-containing protein [Streptomyces sp. TLI_053]|uniref:PQQ-binding-like beta-propeller repeat protein n=1 Tax=Streptomyces sp. TLI_053 TaxID=1855352 RepID=UPI00087AF8C2|nr:PQQ-binding-like beta-propeller repeat protein [Streptomyces sp. TLI_053]SDS60851.1 PQQ enzyme repeat-containing protein [Streptomyces sp. TLI_053]